MGFGHVCSLFLKYYNSVYTIFVKTAIVGQNKAGSVLRYYSEIRYAEFKKMIDKNLNKILEKKKKKEEKKKIKPEKLAIFHKGNLRSGQELVLENSVIVLGDVNFGAKVTSKGNVIVLGTLFGNVFAGCDGDKNAFVLAMDMQPTQIRIGNVIARSSDETRRRRDDIEPKIAYVEDDRIYVEAINRNVVKDMIAR